MQATSPSYHPDADMGWMTATSLILIGVFAILTVLAILYGMRLKARRREADRIERERLEAETPAVEPVRPNEPEPALAERAPAPAPEPLPVAPPPPPLDPVPAPPPPPADPEPAAPDVADEPIPAAAPLEAAPAVEAAPEPELAPAPEPAPAEVAPTGDASPAPSPAAPPGDRPLTTLKGLGPKVAARMEELGVANIGALAALDAAQAEALDARLGPFTGRMARDRWIEQAKLLAAGDDKGFEAVFGRL